MQYLGDIAFIEDALLSRDQVKHDGWVVQNAAGVFRPPLFVQFDPFELWPNTLFSRLALDGFRPDAEMNGGFKLDALLLIGTAVDTEIDAAERQVMVEPLEPSIA